MGMTVEEYFQNREMKFELNFAAEAENLFNKQPGRWIRLLRDLQQKLSASQEGFQNVLKSLDLLARFIESSGNIFFHNHSQDFAMVSGRIPLLASDIPENLLAGQYLQVLAAIAVEVIPPLQPLIAKAGTDTSLFIHFSHPLIAKETFFYLSRGTRLFEKQENHLKDITSQAEDLRERLKKTADNIFVGLSDNSREIFAKHERSISQADVKISEISSEFENFIEDGQKRIDAARSSAFEGAVLGSAVQIWSNKHRSHRLGFWFGILLLSVVICGGSAAFFYHHDYITDLIPKKSDGDIAYGIIVLLLVPTIAVAWLVKILGRFVINAGTLGDDARQRSAMITTYLNLINNPDVKMEQGERLLLLSAIFRPIAGQGQDDLSGPTAAELVKEALSKK